VKIEVLYVPGCPHHQPAVGAVARVLASESLQAPICEVPVNSQAEAKALRFPGSPTIRINGVDVELEPVINPGLACRLYMNGTGIPTEEAIRHALSTARQGE
jgi:hypothetical protein